MCSTLVHLWALLQSMTNLIPLGMEDIVKNTPVQVLGCLKVTEQTHRLGLSLLGLKTFGVNEWYREKTRSTYIIKIENDLKRSVAKYTKVWLIAAY